jgi:hypothetical protein
VRQPRLLDERRNIVGFEGLFENLAPAREVSAHDGVLGVRDGERPALIADPRAEKFGGELVFHFLDPLSIGVTKKKADHAIGNTIDEGIDDGSTFFPPNRSKTLACREPCPIQIAASSSHL